MTEPIITHQAYDLRAMGQLWAARKTMSEDDVRTLDSIYRNKKGAGLTATNEVRYQLARSKAGQAGYGRLFGLRNDIGRAPCYIRAALTSALYHDLDIVNCQPVLLAQLAAQQEIALPSLDGYVQRREETLAELGDHYNCSRADAKLRVLETLNGAKRDEKDHPLLLALAKEIRTLAKDLLAIPEWKTLWDLIDGDGKRTYGRFIADVYQTLERRCLVALYDYLRLGGWSPDVLIFDGLMVRKREGVPVDADLLGRCSDAIHANTGFRVALAEKPLEPLSPEATTAEPGPTPDVSAAAYAAMKAEFEKTHFYLADGCKVAHYDDTRNVVRQYSKLDAVDALNTWRFPSPSGRFVDDELFVPLWLKDPSRRIVKEFRMGAPSDDPSVFVIPFHPAWDHGDASPFADAEAAVAAFQTFLAHLVPEESLRNLLVEWIADLLQRPFVNSQTCMVLAGGKGCGKDTLGDFVGNWLLGGAYYMNYDSTDQFWDRYDNGRFGRILVKLEEAQGSLNRQNEAAFKARITAETMTVNPKFEKPMTMPNYARYLLTTNEANPVKLDDQERRFVVIPCGRGLIGNMDYWRDLRSTLFNRHGAYAVARWLMEQKIGQFPRVLPKSDLHEMVVNADRSVEERFVASSEPWGREMSATELYPLYRAWCFANGEVAKVSSSAFGRALTQVYLDGKVRKRLLNGRTLYSQPDSVELV